MSPGLSLKRIMCYQAKCSLRESQSDLYKHHHHQRQPAGHQRQLLLDRERRDSSRRSRRERRRQQPQQSSGVGGSECKPTGSRFSVLAEAESDEETPEQQSNFSEAEAEKELLELLNVWVHSCPVARGGGVRQAAYMELEAMIAWLPTQCTLHPGPTWAAAVARQLSGCEEALLSLAAWRV